MDTMVEFFESGTMVIGRINPGGDLVPGLLKALHGCGYRYAVVVSLIGSLKETAFVYIQPDSGSPIGIRYGERINIPGGVEIVSCQGMLGLWNDGRPSAHLHYSLIDTAGKLHAGHVLDEGNVCLATVEFALAATKDCTITRAMDGTLGFPRFGFRPAG